MEIDEKREIKHQTMGTRAFHKKMQTDYFREQDQWSKSKRS